MRKFFREGDTSGKTIQSINIFKKLTHSSEFYFKHLSTGRTIVRIFDYRLNFMKRFNDKEHHETHFANIRNLISPSNRAYETIISKKFIQAWMPES